MNNASAAEKQTREQAAELKAIFRVLEKLLKRVGAVYQDRRVDEIANPLHESMRYLAMAGARILLAQAECEDATFEEVRA